MKQILKQVLGIDVAQKELVVTLGKMYNDFTLDLYAYKVFKNNKIGFAALLKWLDPIINKEIKLQFVMEATGVYHQKFAYYLDKKKCNLTIVLPNKISNYMRTLNVRTITDKTASQAICQFGLERKLECWTKPKKVYKELQQLTRERSQIVDERVIVKNQLHAEKTEAEPNKSSLKRLKTRIEFLNQQEKEIKIEIQNIVNKDTQLKKELKNICTIPGVGMLTAVIVIAETNGFELIRNKKQITSYAGLDIKEKQSGTSIRSKTRISKKGNRNLRKAMHLPSLSAVKYNKTHKELYLRLTAKSGVKMKGLIAVQRKLLELIYVVYKNKEGFIQNYEQQKRATLLEIETAL
ncbi:IS110 family transposase [Olleya sp. HaHaR_3_96]|uniref:IS110 family transposase n=1 Tax=Olleya sp. HaHaR_3_96 TaxID=2745560 RepID=UPI001C4EF41A|nr:IS110 family transposase [Olleya sp. HaHaR_3_96]QXP59838.1 IS110 family transposase [Olleya sp. HaHaR_3_96]QXP60874.1 IS110 family transposase [Olleya sp. HaHaR_3_96]